MAAEVSVKSKSKSAVLDEVGSSNQTVRIKIIQKKRIMYPGETMHFISRGHVSQPETFP